MEVGTRAGILSWFKTRLAVQTSICVMSPFVNRHALSLYVDASFVVTPPAPESWTLQSAKFPLCWKLSASAFATDNFRWLLGGMAGTFPFLWGSFSHHSPLQKWYLYTSLWEVVRSWYTHQKAYVFLPHICIYTYIVGKDTSIHTHRPWQSILKQRHRGFAFFPPYITSPKGFMDCLIFYSKRRVRSQRWINHQEMIT